MLGKRGARLSAALLALGLGVVWGLACSNNPYPESDDARKVYYSAFGSAPRTLDPAVAYNTAAHAITGLVYDTLLEYHYLERPYKLIPGLAEALPEAEEREGGQVAYRFRLRPGMLYAPDPAFGLAEPGRTTREIRAADVAFQLMRLADPDVNSPVFDPFANIVGFREFREGLRERRKQDAAFAARPVHEQYAELGPPEGIVVEGDLELEILLSAPYPQILYWFALEFSTPVPWEAVAYHDGNEGRDRFDDHPVGSGPYQLVRYDKQFRMVLEQNPNWYGKLHPEWKAPGAIYPSTGEPEDRAAGRLDPELAGRPLPFIERIELHREKEAIPRFNKFMQGYYDAQGSVIKESFDQVIQNGRLTPEMEGRGVVLEKSVGPGIFYVGFNMRDPVLGHDAGERGRKLRQAMSLAIDSEEWIELFQNGRGLTAQSPVPPGLFGYDPEYRNPFRIPDLERAKRLLKEAGYPGGVDPATGKPLRITFDSYQTSSSAQLTEQHLANAWRQIGLDVRLDATTYNQFHRKVEDGAYQIFFWGWHADYPDPENFFFLLACDQMRLVSGGPNYTNFCDPRFEALFAQMRVRENDTERERLIREMVALLEEERPWIEIFHREDYSLYHGWLEQVKPFGMSVPMWKYRDIDPQRRAATRLAWNEPVVWPAWVMLAVAVAGVLPGFRTFFRERQ